MPNSGIGQGWLALFDNLTAFCNVRVGASLETGVAPAPHSCCLGDNVTLATNGGGFTTQTAFDPDGNVTKAVDADGNTTLYAFDKQDLMTLSTDARGFTTQQSYDLDGNQTQVITPGGGTTGFAYDGDANATKIVNADGFTTSQSFDGDDRLTKTVNPDNVTTTAAFDSAGRETKSVDGAGNTVTTQYDPASHVTKMVDGAGNTTSSQYDPAGLLTVSLDGRGFTTSYNYDPDQRLTKTVDSHSYSTLQSYDPAGQVTKAVDADSHTVLTSFDPAGLATKVVDGDGYTSTTAFDADNRETKVVDGDGHTTLAAYDPNGNVTLATDGAGVTTQTAFDKDANVTMTVAHGYTTTSGFDPDNNQTASIDGDGNTTTNAFDPANQVTKVTDPDSNATTYALDGGGNATLITNPSGYTTQQKFDGDGRITQRITPDGGTVNFTYDGNGRVTGDGNGPRSYNADGLLATASNTYGTYAFSYDQDDRVTNVTEPFSQSLSYAYDPAGNQTKVTDSQSGTTVSTYDSDNYLTERTYTGQLQNLRVNFTNNEEGWNTTQARYSDLAGTTLVTTSKYQYDGAGNVTNVLATDHAGATIDQFGYALDSHGNLSSETDTQNGTATTINYGYDSAGQITSASGSSYGYDSNGNRNTGSDTVTTGNQMSADANWTYKYDKEGELTEKDSTVGGSSEKWTYAWSANGNLTEAKHYNAAGSLALTVDYEYDAFGEMIQQSDGTVTSRYAKDGWNSNMAVPNGNENMNTWAVLNGSNQWQERDVWGNKIDQELGRVVLSANNYTLYPLQDRQQSVRDVVTAAGVVDDSIAYDAFGNITVETNSAYRGHYAWTGRQFDIETDLQYNHARWYDPATGRWQSQDPLGFDAGDSNLYRYVVNKPTFGMDPSGLYPIPVTMNVLAYALKSKNVPIGFARELGKLNATTVSHGSATTYAANWVFSGGVITLKDSSYDKFAISKATGIDVGLACNEISNAFFDQIIERRPEGKWMLELAQNANMDTYFFQLYRNKVGLAWWLGGSNTSMTEAMSEGLVMVDEAMSEIAQLLVPHFQSKIAPTMAQMRRVATPAHNDSFLSRWGREPFKTAANTPVPDYIIHMTLWMMQYGSKNPAPGGDMQQRIKLLKKNWDVTWKNIK